jgi:predicted N-acetyltransferase YhbS
VYQFKQEQQSDWWEVEALYDLCFAPGREALSSYRLRDQVAPVVDLSMVARDPDGILGGAIRYCRSLWDVITRCFWGRLRCTRPGRAKGWVAR